MFRPVLMTAIALAISFASFAQPCDDCPYVKPTIKELAPPPVDDGLPDEARRTTTGYEMKMLAPAPTHVWPNPSSGVVTFIPGQREQRAYTWMILDQLGRPVSSGNGFGTTPQQIDLSQMAKGMYLLSINDGREQITSRILLH